MPQDTVIRGFSEDLGYCDNIRGDLAKRSGLIMPPWGGESRSFVAEQDSTGKVLGSPAFGRSYTSDSGMDLLWRPNRGLGR